MTAFFFICKNDNVNINIHCKIFTKIHNILLKKLNTHTIFKYKKWLGNLLYFLINYIVQCNIL